MKTVLVKAWRGGKEKMNLGEWFCEMLLAGLGYGIDYIGGKTSRPALIMIGSGVFKRYIDSLLRQSPEAHIWGAGSGEATETPVDCRGPRIKVHAIRGPLTAALSHVSGVPVMDAAFALPVLHPIRRRPSREVLYVPHHAERGKTDPAKFGASAEIDVIMTRAQSAPVLERIVNADFVVTGTLHTMLACIAYGTPCAFYAPYRRNMPLKWVDSFAAMGHDMPPSISNIKQAREWWEAGKPQSPDPGPLVAAFPHDLAVSGTVNGGVI